MLSETVRVVIKEETESFTAMQNRIREDGYQRCLKAGVTAEYLDQLTTAFVADGTLGFNMFHTEFLFKAGVDPEYANRYLVVGNRGELSDIVVLFNAGVEPELGILGLRKGLTHETIIGLHEQGIPAEYVAEMDFSTGLGLSLVLKAC